MKNIHRLLSIVVLGCSLALSVSPANSKTIVSDNIMGAKAQVERKSDQFDLPPPAVKTKRVYAPPTTVMPPHHGGGKPGK